MTVRRRSGVAISLWSIALPAMITNVATALFGLADMWVIGQIGDAAAQGAVELGAKYMLALLNIFNFLRTSTVALTAQAAGSDNAGEQGQTLARASAVALAIGFLLLAAMPFAIPVGLDLMEASGQVREHAMTYVGIRYWAAPIWLCNCVLVGWLIGRRMVTHVLVIEVLANVVHICLDLFLVLHAHMGVAGVAAATLTSELLKFLLLAGVVLNQPSARAALLAARDRTTWQRPAMTRLFALNRDLFARTVILTGSIVLFARIGAQQGAITLAANGILFQLFMLSTLLLDGFESAAQVLCGEASGANDKERFRASVRSGILWAVIAGAVLTAVYALFAGALSARFSTDQQVIAATARYVPWLVALPVIGATSFVLDGVFVGAGWTRGMLATMALGTAIYLVMLWALAPLGNDGLWAAFTAFMLVRGAGQLAILPRMMRRSFRSS